MFDYDAELRPHTAHLRAAAAVDTNDRVLDVGCGTGQTTRDAARAATAGSALGVDISGPALATARTRSAGLSNIAFEEADAAVHAFPAAHFDVCLSRFGTMFFADPVAAFTNIAMALRPGARLALLVWQAAERNEWSTVIGEALGTPPRPAAFSLADPASTGDVLTSAGLTDIAFTDVREPVYYGPDPSAAFEAVMYLERAAGTDPDPAARRRLRAAVAGHATPAGVTFDSRAWLITAHRA
ncbi:methyltransferase domain-containing protein [Dactylosporangium sp. NPDC050588]|uniref:class I SAM-dependent methyltransferase n=1 Tax=Dactylosporangium sp. NPDC050588 TaxID=3157211 RepID=UPI00340D853C